ncbi:MAG: hypothetical protein H8F28_09320 [Fibrella sp.]|nr:hypothetical protein [Armatimonadota bacterium]
MSHLLRLTMVRWGAGMGQFRTILCVAVAVMPSGAGLAKPPVDAPPRYRLTRLPMETATVLNDRGQVAGHNWSGEGILYTPGKKPRSLGHVPSHPPGRAGLVPEYLSNDGAVYGYSTWVTSGAITSGETVHFRWNKNKMMETDSECSPSRFRNRRGEYAYTAARGEFERQPDDSVRYDEWMAVLQHGDGTKTELGTLGGKSSHVNAINADGKIVGWSEVQAGSGRGFLYSGGTMRPLSLVPGTPDLPSIGTTANAINDLGEIVGHQTARDAKKVHQIAVLWDRDGKAHDLNTLVTPPLRTSRSLYAAVAINARGQIIGQGSDGAFLLTPVPPKRAKKRP